MAYLARMQYSVVNVGGTKVSEKGGGGLGWADIELSENKVNVCVDSAFQFHTASIMKEPKMMVRKLVLPEMMAIGKQARPIDTNISILFATDKSASHNDGHSFPT